MLIIIVIVHTVFQRPVLIRLNDHLHTNLMRPDVSIIRCRLVPRLRLRFPGTQAHSRRLMLFLFLRGKFSVSVLHTETCISR